MFPTLSCFITFLKQNNTVVSKAQLQECWDTVLIYNPWLPDEGILNLDAWELVVTTVIGNGWITQ